MIQSWCHQTPNAEIIKPPQKQRAAVNIVLRGPTRSTQRPNTAADTPRKKIARLKIHASDGCDQSPGADLVTPMIFVRGNLKTLNAYTCPIERWTASAAGGKSQRL